MDNSAIKLLVRKPTLPSGQAAMLDVQAQSNQPYAPVQSSAVQTQEGALTESSAPVGGQVFSLVGPKLSAIPVAISPDISKTVADIKTVAGDKLPAKLPIPGGQLPGMLPKLRLSDPVVNVPEPFEARRSGAWYSVLGASLPEVLRAIDPVFAQEYERAGRTWSVASNCAVADGDSLSTRYQKLRIQTCSVLEFGATARPAAIVQHYADLDAARQWFNYAYALATDDVLIATLDAVNPKSGRWDDDRGAEPVGFLAQVRYARAITEAIANGYNALNIPWANDPIARGLWRDYLAGQDSGSDTSVSTDYNAGQFFRKDRDAERLNSNLARAILKARNSNAGAIPAALVELVARVTPQQDRHPIRFYFSAGVMLTAITSDDGSPYYASRAVNRGFATTSLSDNRRTGPWSSRHEVLALADVSRSNVTDDRYAVRLANVERFEEYQNDWYANRSSTDRVRRDWGLASAPEYTDWRAFSYDTWTAEQSEEEISAVAPMRWYLNWLREWAKSLTVTTPMVSDALLPDCPVPQQRSPQTRNGVPRRDVTRILVDSLSWASDLNMRWVRALGDRAFNDALALSLQDQVSASVPEPNRTVTLIGETVGGTARLVGDALLPGVGSLIGSGVSAITTLIARLIPEPQRLRFGRDDLGRPKPSFERLALDGSIRDGQLPTFSMVPPGYCRRLGVDPATTLGSSLCGVSAGGTTGSGDTGLDFGNGSGTGGTGGAANPTPTPDSSLPKIALAVAVVVAVIFAVRAMSNSGQSSSIQTKGRGSR